MIEFRPCLPWHLALVDAQEAQAGEKPVDLTVVRNSLALSCWVDDSCVAVGGLLPIWPGRAAAWALFGKDAGPAMLAITRKLAFVLATKPASRIEMTVRADFAPGCRLAAVLGFRLETPRPMERFFRDGTAAFLFARVNQP